MHHPTVRVFLAGGVPEVMLHLRDMGLLDTSVLTATGQTLSENLRWWETSERRKRFRQILREQDGVDPDDVIMSPARAGERGLTSTVTFPRGNLAPEGCVISPRSRKARFKPVTSLCLPVAGRLEPAWRKRISSPPR
jgi:dihydroxyacid dehydratase/phosphogluconate dehydratase